MHNGIWPRDNKNNNTTITRKQSNQLFQGKSISAQAPACVSHCFTSLISSTGAGQGQRDREEIPRAAGTLQGGSGQQLVEAEGYERAKARMREKRAAVAQSEAEAESEPSGSDIANAEV